MNGWMDGWMDVCMYVCMYAYHMVCVCVCVCSVFNAGIKCIALFGGMGSDYVLATADPDCVAQNLAMVVCIFLCCV